MLCMGIKRWTRCRVNKLGKCRCCASASADEWPLRSDFPPPPRLALAPYTLSRFSPKPLPAPSSFHSSPTTLTSPLPSPSNPSRVTAVAFSPSQVAGGTHLVSAHDDGQLRAWDTNTGLCVRMHRKKGTELSAVVYLPR